MSDIGRMCDDFEWTPRQAHETEDCRTRIAVLEAEVSEKQVALDSMERDRDLHWDEKDKALAALAALKDENERLRGELDYCEGCGARLGENPLAAELATLKADYEVAQVCGSCDHFNSFGSALYCTIEVPTRIHAYDHERDYSCRCQYEPSRWEARP